MNEDTSLQARLDDVEARFTFQEDNVHHLNLTVAQQQREIEELRARIEYLAKQVRSLGSHELTDGGEEPPPPHY